jgi:hypothetical protein
MRRYSWAFHDDPVLESAGVRPRINRAFVSRPSRRSDATGRDAATG